MFQKASVPDEQERQIHFVASFGPSMAASACFLWLLTRLPVRRRQPPKLRCLLMASPILGSRTRSCCE